MTVIAIVVPLVIALAICVPRTSALALRAAPWAALPALGAIAGSSVQSEVVLVGARLGGADPVTRGFLLLAATVWLAAGLYARSYVARDPHRARFWVFFLVTEAGNIGVALAQDVGSFYLFYSVVSFASYGLVVHAQTEVARRAGRVYLVMSLASELLLLTAFVLIVGESINLSLPAAAQAVARSPSRELVVWLLLAGFGIKAGVVVLHVWLPLAHPVAPTPASAVLSGAIVAVGVLGWLRFLPLGVVALRGVGIACVVLGFTGAYYAVVVGVMQRDAKTILAYSSVSQLGFATATVGVALAVPETAVAAAASIVFFALHHALAKAALFLGVGVVHATPRGHRRSLALLGLLVSALALAGAPLTSGAAAKTALEHVMVGSGTVPAGLLYAAAIGTTVLMAKLLAVVRADHVIAGSTAGLWQPWLLLLILGAVLVGAPLGGGIAALVDPSKLASATWPVLAGIALAVLARRVLSARLAVASIPSGDVLVVAELVYVWLRKALAVAVLAATRYEAMVLGAAARRIAAEERWRAVVRSALRLERSFATSAVIGGALLVLGIVLAWAARW